MSLSDLELQERVERLRALQEPCQLCPRRCRVDRRHTLGFCRQPLVPQVAAACVHHGEEPALCGERGAGTVFVVGCTMRCLFCQNYQISQVKEESPRWRASVEGLAASFLALERRGCHNLEWVSPTQHLPALVEALRLARVRGLALPVVFNCNGYHRLSVLRLLEGIVDIYLPDAKYGTDELAQRFSTTPDYVAVNRRALREMQRQVGSLELDAQSGLARRGLIVRHLVLPGHVGNTRAVLEWIGQALGPQTWVSLMAQFYPAHETPPELDRRLTRREYQWAAEALYAAGLEQGWIQQRATGTRHRPDFTRSEPFAPSAPGLER